MACAGVRQATSSFLGHNEFAKQLADGWDASSTRKAADRGRRRSLNQSDAVTNQPHGAHSIASAGASGGTDSGLAGEPAQGPRSRPKRHPQHKEDPAARQRRLAAKYPLHLLKKQDTGKRGPGAIKEGGNAEI